MDFEMEGMTCGHCERAVTRAVHSVDPAAKVTVDRSAGRVYVDSPAGNPEEALRNAISAEGYIVNKAVGGS